jgi:16S rRNA (adenine1518-N6/adenine1519-N6)-dimethyltransferase
MTIEHLKEILKQYGIKPTDKLGQNFMLDETILEDMVDSAGVSSTDLVIEIGPGIGNLTERLLERAKSVVAIEKDVRMMPILKQLKKTHPTFEFYNADGLTFDYSALFQRIPLFKKGEPSGGCRVVANIPYYITGKLIQIFLHLNPKPKSITLLVQKEVAQNIVAEPGNLSILGISVQIMGYPKIVAQVPAFKFYPQPKVDSSVVHIDIPEKPPYKISDEKEFFRVVKACFMGKRKQIHNTLRSNVGLSEVAVEKALAHAGIDTAARPQHVTIPQWIALVEAIDKNI